MSTGTNAELHSQFEAWHKAEAAVKADKLTLARLAELRVADEAKEHRLYSCRFERCGYDGHEARGLRPPGGGFDGYRQRDHI